MPDTAKKKPARPQRASTKAGEWGGRLKDKTIAEREKFWRAVLVEHNGNITRAAEAAEISCRAAMKLNDEFGLKEFARDLRLATGAPATGRPPGS